MRKALEISQDQRTLFGSRPKYFYRECSFNFKLLLKSLCPQSKFILKSLLKLLLETQTAPQNEAMISVTKFGIFKIFGNKKRIMRSFSVCDFYQFSV